MKVLIIGGGGREHALAWAIGRSPRVDHVYCAPGNGGTALVGTNVDIAADDVTGLVAFAKETGIDMTIVGPEAALVAGIADRFAEEEMRCYGPSAAAARLEGSKIFAKEFMRRHGIPTADFEVFDDPATASDYVRRNTPPFVIKADGLAAGKGVILAQSTTEALEAIDAIMGERRFGDAGAKIVIEEFLTGDEVSIHAICAGGKAILLPSSQDHKRAYDGDTGPNTGGMGAYAPVPTFGTGDLQRVLDTVVTPVLAGMANEGAPYIGTLYVGLMLSPNGMKVLEFNVRFGDPETEVLLPLIKSDLFELFFAVAGGEVPDDVELWSGRSAATVVMASTGYPESYQKGHAITGLDSANREDVVVFHAGTTDMDGTTVTSGGRVLAVTAWGNNVRDAIVAAYGGVRRIDFDGAFWRKDIGNRVCSELNAIRKDA